MNIKIKKVNKGFTLLEILLVIAAIGILAAIVLVAINPTRQIAQVRNAQRRSDINTIYKALEQYLIDNKDYPEGITEASQAICNNTVTTDCINLSVLVPTYLAAIPKDPSGGLYKVYINSANNRIGVEATGVELGQSIVVNPIVVTATGGNITTINQNGIWYKVHTFTTNGTFTVTGGSLNIEYLVVGGGGSGGQGGAGVGGGGGGAGGFRTATGFAVSAGTYPVTVGAGSSTANTNGVNSSFSTIISLGGGYGGPYDRGGNGGSGGGGAGEFRNGGNVVGGTGTAGQGSNGARGYGTMGFTTGSGGGGGGAGGPGQLPSPGNATGTGAGGPGLTSSISGNEVTYATGGMGQSATNTTGTPAAATANTGNGGNAAGGAGGGGFEGPGGSGIVIIRYPIIPSTSTPAPTTVQNGLVLHLDAGNPASYPGTGTTWTDLSGNNNNGTLINMDGTNFNSANGGVLTFDGSDERVDTLNVSSLTNMTIEMWIYDTRSSGNRDLLTYNENSASYTFNGTTFRTDRNGAAGRSFAGVGNPPLNTWYRFCYVKNGDLYINETRYTGTGTDTNPSGIISLGNSRSDLNNRLNGRISIAKIYNRALTAEEIQQNYNATKSRFGL